MNFYSSIKKMTQATGVLLAEEEDHATSYMRILKLLVIADRKSLQRTGRPIIGSEVVAMKDGPLHSVIYDLIRNNHPDVPMWDSFFDVVRRFDLKMHDNPGVDELSRFEVELLQGVSHEHWLLDQWELRDLTHEFEDWEAAWEKSGKSGSVPIALKETLKSLNLEDKSEFILEGVKAHNVAVEIFG